MESGIHIVLKAEELWNIWGFPITNSLLMTWLVMAIVLFFSFFFGRSLKLMPGKLQAGVEYVYEAALGYIAETLEDEKLARQDAERRAAESAEAERQARTEKQGTELDLVTNAIATGPIKPSKTEYNGWMSAV